MGKLEVKGRSGIHAFFVRGMVISWHDWCKHKSRVLRLNAKLFFERYEISQLPLTNVKRALKRQRLHSAIKKKPFLSDRHK